MAVHFPKRVHQAAAVGFEVLLFCGNVPGALSSLYKQASLQYRRVDVFYLSTWITFFQIIIGFAMTPVNTLLPPAEGGVALQDVGTQFSKGAVPVLHHFAMGRDTLTPSVRATCAGAMCLLGQNSVICNLDSCAFYKQVVQNGTSLIQKFNTTAGTRPLDIATCYQYDPLLANNGNPHNGALMLLIARANVVLAAAAHTTPACVDQQVCRSVTRAKTRCGFGPCSFSSSS